MGECLITRNYADHSRHASLSAPDPGLWIRGICGLFLTAHVERALDSCVRNLYPGKTRSDCQ